MSHNITGMNITGRIISWLSSLTRLGGGAAQAGDVLQYQNGTGPLWAAASGGVTDHGALTGLGDDDHLQYQLRSEKAAASGYASLDGSTLVPRAQLGTGTPDSTVFLRGDASWTAPTATADPVTPYAMGTKTIPTGNFVNMARRLILTSSQIVTIQGNGCLRIN